MQNFLSLQHLQVLVSIRLQSDTVVDQTLTFLLSQHLYSSNWGDYAISTLSVVLDFVRLHASFAIRPIISLAASLQLVLDIILLWFNWIIFFVNSGYFTVMLTKPPKHCFHYCLLLYIQLQWLDGLLLLYGCSLACSLACCLLAGIPASCWIFK